MKLKITVLSLLLVFSMWGKAFSLINEGDKAYDFKLQKVGTKTKVKLSDYRGKILIVDFWATWCPPCRYEIPRLVELKKKFKKKPFEIIGVNLDISPKNEKYLKDFMSKFKINYTVLYDNGRMGAIYGIRSIPQTFIIDENGKVIKKYVGFYPGLEKEFERIIAQNLKRLEKVNVRAQNNASKKKTENQSKNEVSPKEKNTDTK